MREGNIVPGIGIMGIHERMRRSGSNLEVNRSDKGTTVTGSLPLAFQ